MNPPAIAIDGPAASGKSTVAKLIAKELGFTFINTGAMYRAVTWYTLQQGVNPADTEAVEALLPGIPLSFGKDGSNSTVMFEGRVLTTELTEKSTNDNVSAIASIPAVRALLVEKQREYNTREAVVMEGRDIRRDLFARLAHRNWPLLTSKPMALSLEDIFISLTNNGGDEL